MIVALAVVACGKGSNKNEQAEAKKQADLAKQADTPPTVEPGKKQDKLCKRIDQDAVAKAIELPGLSRTGNGILVKGGKEPASLVCSYYEKGKMDGGMSFGFAIKAQTELEAKDFLNRFKWEDFDGLGQPAKIGRATNEVHVQTVAKGVLLFVNVKQDGMAVPDLEKRVAAAAKVMIEQLPADAAAELQ